MRPLLTPSIQVVKVEDQNGFEFYLDRDGNPYTYQGDRLTHLSGLNELDGLDGFFKKVSDRFFRDLPKAVVNVFVSPFRSAPVFSPEDFQSRKYGASAGSIKNNRVVGVVGQTAASVILGSDATKFNEAGIFVNNLIPVKQTSIPNSPTGEDFQHSTPQPTAIQKTLLVGGVLLVLAASVVFLVSSKEQIKK